MTWLVTGGAGYIGSHTVRRLCAAGHQVVVLDNLSSGNRDRIPAGVPLVVGEVADRAAVTATLREYGVTGVLHFAGQKSPTDSMSQPVHYYEQNVGGMISLLGAVVDAGVRRFVFSSSAAVYGIPSTPVVTEETPATPLNPYGASKLVCEWMLRSTAQAHDLSWIALRYFNVVGSDDPILADRGAINLFPLIFTAMTEDRPALVTGDDYPTRDGTGIRDYVHVADLADAHVAAVARLVGSAEKTGDFYNVGTGVGYSVLEVLDAIRAETGQPVPHVVGPRRPGDPPEVVASAEKIAAELGWRARRDLAEMVGSAWRSWAAQHAPA